ncbi:MAG TPA: Fe-S cluster assembly ATPase SufC, partial [Candidatus Saccharimonadales bacterium]|nr:Fe-S cluster assembly ATPase SufC [Candidatus Saccharimonadales bacterium]
HVSTDNKEILKGLNLKIDKGEIHAIMGPNGSGKSSLSLALMGHPRYLVNSGLIKLDGEDLIKLTPDKRAKLGLFLAMQYPVAVPGVSVFNLLRSANKNLESHHVSALEFQKIVKKSMKNLKIDEKFLTRSVNDGFSGGEKKKVETLQLSILKPKYAILDETDSGLDVDALKIVSQGINNIYSKNIGILLITHYQRILKYVKPNFVHILVDGKIVKSGGAELAETVEEKGYVNI